MSSAMKNSSTMALLFACVLLALVPASALAYITGGESVFLMVPVDGNLEAIGRTWCVPDSDETKRMDGAEILRHFKNETNVQLLKSLLEQRLKGQVHRLVRPAERDRYVWKRLAQGDREEKASRRAASGADRRAVNRDGLRRRQLRPHQRAPVACTHKIHLDHVYVGFEQFLSLSTECSQARSPLVGGTDELDHGQKPARLIEHAEEAPSSWSTDDGENTRTCGPSAYRRWSSDSTATRSSARATSPGGSDRFRARRASPIRTVWTSSQCGSKYGSMPGNRLFMLVIIRENAGPGGMTGTHELHWH
jgi:hypothetical protein